MKRMQKRMGNKGFSLVELIVVIAIMAVLVGVLAPTLIKNVEKSKESKDVQNLDTIRSAVVTALTNTSVYDEIVLANGKSDTLNNFMSATYPNTSAELNSALNNAVPTLSAKANKDASIYVTITKDGKVIVYSGKGTPAANSYDEAAKVAIKCTSIDGNFIVQ